MLSQTSPFGECLSSNNNFSVLLEHYVLTPGYIMIFIYGSKLSAYGGDFNVLHIQHTDAVYGEGSTPLGMPIYHN